MKNFIALLVFAGGFTAWFFYHQKAELTEGLEAASQQLAQLEQNLASKRQEFQAMSGMMNIKSKITAKRAELAELQSKTKSVQQAARVATEEKKAALALLRQRFVGQTLPIKLMSGRDLGSVRVMKLDDSGLSVATTSGIVKIQPNELPQELRGKFLYSF